MSEAAPQSAETTDLVEVGNLYAPGHPAYALIVSRKAMSTLARGKEEKPTLPRLYVFNLVFAGAVGTATLVWLANYTEHLTILQTALGLGGVFVWLAFLASILTDARKDLLREWVDEFLASPWATALCVAGLLALVAYIGRESAIVLTGIDDDAEQRAITITPVDKTSGFIREKATLKKNDTVRVTVPSGLFPFHTDYLVHVNGLPVIRRSVAPFWLTMVTVPESFKERPVVLLRLDPQTAANVNSYANDPRNTAEVKITVTVKRGKDLLMSRSIHYSGNSVWVGCNDRVPIPSEISDEWKLATDRIRTLFNNPISLMEDVILRDGDTISAVIKSDTEFARLPSTPIRGRSYRNVSAQLITIPGS